MKKLPYSKYLFVLLFLAILTVAVLIIKPFIPTLVVSAILAYVLYPVYLYFTKLTGRKGFSAMVLILMIILISAIPITIVVGTVTKESIEIYSRAKDVFLDSDSFEQVCSSGQGLICGSYKAFTQFSEKYDLDLGFHLARAFTSLASDFVAKASDFIINIPKFMLHIFIGLFAMYYMFVDGKDIIAAIKKNLPMRIEHSDRIFLHFNDIIYATIYGAIVLAIIQGSIAGVGYLVFGVPSPLLLGLLTIVTSFIPFLGAALVWLPVSVTMFINGVLTSNDSLMLRAGGLALYGALLVSTIDNFLRPKIVGDRARVHPLVILLGVFGGMALFDFVGVIVGPLLLTLFIAILKIYEQEKEHIM